MQEESTREKMKRLFASGNIKGWGKLLPQLEKEVREERKNTPKEKYVQRTEED